MSVGKSTRLAIYADAVLFGRATMILPTSSGDHDDRVDALTHATAALRIFPIRFGWSRRVLYRILRSVGHLFAALAYRVDPDAAIPEYRRTAVEGELFLAGNYWGMARGMIRYRVASVIRSIEEFRLRMRGELS